MSQSKNSCLSAARRAALAALGLGAVAIAGALVGPVVAQQQGAAATKAPAPADDIAKAGPLGDIVIGKPDAPVTIIEYASMTCPYCATFHTRVLPALKQKYVDTGKVRIVFREFPLDNRAAAASMLARCAAPDKAADVIAKLFETQDSWAPVAGNVKPALFKAAEAAGFTSDAFNKCLENQKLLDDVVAVGERGRKSFGVNATPTFFINGKKFEGRADQIAAFEAVLDPLVK